MSEPFSTYTIYEVELLPHDLVFCKLYDTDGYEVKNKKIYATDTFNLVPLNIGGKLFDRELQVVWGHEIKGGWIIYCPDRVLVRDPDQSILREHNV